MSEDEDKHLDAFVNFVKSDKNLLKALQDKDWAAFAKSYNGPDYAKNKYDEKIKSAFDTFTKEGLPEDESSSSSSSSNGGASTPPPVDSSLEGNPDQL